MSDYFGALMRASGISFGIPAAAGAGARDIGLAIERTGEEPAMPAERRPAPVSERLGMTAEDSMQASSNELRREWAGTSGYSVRAMPPTAPILAQRVDGAPASTAAFPGFAEAVSAPEDATTGGPARPIPTPQASIQAALQWVAAGSAPHGRTDSSASSTDPTSSRESISSIGPGTALSLDAMPVMQYGEDYLERPSPPLAEFAAIAAPPSRVTRAALARPLPNEASERAHPGRRGEAIEVSIGAIHVRVDAPAAQTVAQPAVPAAPAMPQPSVSARAPQSSRLARRALRRI